LDYLEAQKKLKERGRKRSKGTLEGEWGIDQKLSVKYGLTTGTIRKIVSKCRKILKVTT